MQAKNIDEVIEDLDKIIASAKIEKSRLGYFSALYRKVTLQIRKGIQEEYFDDGERMGRLDTIFANRYLVAFDQYRRNGQAPTQSWQLAFDKTQDYWPIVLQHLLWAMNAHINLDLGIAAAQVAPKEQLSALKGDFYKINEILSSLINEVEDELAKVWFPLKFLDRLAGNLDECVASFSMEKARDEAWRVAEHLAPLSKEEQEPQIQALDSSVYRLGKVLQPPSFLLRVILRAIRLGEKGSIPKIIEILM